MTMPRIYHFIRYVLVFALFSATAGKAAWAAPLNEYEVKAAFLFNFAKFVEWPAGPSESMTLCLIGADPYEGALKVFENRMVDGKRFTSHRIKLQSDAELMNCNILYIAHSERERFAGLLQAIKGAPILTVGDYSGYARQGVMINFYLDQDKVRFEINPSAAKQAGLRISAKLIKLGQIVGTQE
ncbi:YfiR family protein [Dechloromonas sp.]|uniref:YfiR family protein n=1 Tax=Dechloromonas sp. TaxID=1917218 RepID=UPI00286E4AB2|nr:YfiR family protein [Dechloromonas sp.]